MNLQMWRVGPDKVEDPHTVLKRCGEDLKQKGLEHWESPYPIEALRKDAEERMVYRLRLDRELAGTFTIGTKPLEYYDENIWSSPGEKAMYVSHLAVLPGKQGNGIGTWCMREIERVAVEEECGSVRLDAYEKHHRLLEFYEKLGYEKRGVVEERGFPLVCLEKKPTIEEVGNTAPDPVSIAIGFNIQVNAQNVEGLRELMTEGYKFIDSKGDVDYGRDEMTQGWADFFKSFPDYQNIFTHVEARGDLVVILGHSTCSYEPLHGPAIWTAKIRDRLVAEWRVYDDTEENRRRLQI